MGQTPMQPNLVHIAEHLTPTQVRCGICVSRMTRDKTPDLYRNLVSRYDDEQIHNQGVSMNLQQQRALSSAASDRELYFILQQQVCEICRSRRPCIQRRCRLCRNYSATYFPTNRIQICCVCSGFWIHTKHIKEAEESMRSSAKVWQEQAPAHAKLFNINLPDLGKDYGGLLVKRDMFDNALSVFWRCVMTARKYRSSKGNLDTMLLQQFGEDAVRYMSLVFSRSHLDLQGYPGTHNQHRQRTQSSPIIEWVQGIGTKLWNDWIDAPVCQEKIFFCHEKLMVEFGGRLVSLLRRIQTTNMDVKLDRILKLADISKTSEVAGKQHREADIVDALAVLLVHHPLSHAQARPPPFLVAHFGFSICEGNMQVVFHTTKVQAAKLLKRMEQQNEPELAELGRKPLMCGQYAGFTFAEGWCSNPDIIDRLARSSPDNEQLKKFCAFAHKLDPKRSKKLKELRMCFERVLMPTEALQKAGDSNAEAAKSKAQAAESKEASSNGAEATDTKLKDASSKAVAEAEAKDAESKTKAAESKESRKRPVEAKDAKRKDAPRKAAAEAKAKSTELKAQAAECKEARKRAAESKDAKPKDSPRKAAAEAKTKATELKAQAAESKEARKRPAESKDAKPKDASRNMAAESKATWQLQAAFAPRNLARPSCATTDKPEEMPIATDALPVIEAERVAPIEMEDATERSAHSSARPSSAEARSVSTVPHQRKKRIRQIVSSDDE